jgi:hypothetical protein
MREGPSAKGLLSLLKRPQQSTGKDAVRRLEMDLCGHSV